MRMRKKMTQLNGLTSAPNKNRTVPGTGAADALLHVLRYKYIILQKPREFDVLHLLGSCGN